MGARSFASLFADDLIALELPGISAQLRHRTHVWVLTRIGAAGDVARLGLELTGALLALAVRLRHGRAYGQLDPERRRAVAAWLAATSLPLAAEYVRAVRSLAVTYAYDALYATAP